MSKQLITPETKPQIPYRGGTCLAISEMFYDSIQGEGITIGYPAAFIRLQGCTLDCIYCDTKAIREVGHTFGFRELFDLIEQPWKDKEGWVHGSMLQRLIYEQHLVFTGGSPLLQQINVILFVNAFMKRYDFKPFIEVENECVLSPHVLLINLVDLWSNSPKLSNSLNSPITRYNQVVIRQTAKLSNSWFKFVICKESDWLEIKQDFLDPGHIRREQILLMPQGKTREELIKNSKMVVELATRENVRYSPREHVMLWDDEIGK